MIRAASVRPDVHATLLRRRPRKAVAKARGILEYPLHDYGPANSLSHVTPSGVLESIAIEQARYINGNLPTSVIGGFFIACIVAATFWKVAPHRDILIWLATGLTVGSYRMAMWRFFTRETQNWPMAHACIRHAMIGTALSGCLWGLTVLFLMPPGNILFQVILVFAISMMGVSAMFSFGVHYPTFLSFFIPSIVGAVVGLLLLGSTLHLEIAAGIIVFILVALRFAAAFHKMFVRSLELRYQNLGLVKELTAEKETAELANLAKSRFLAAASHDLRQPMHALNLYLGTLAGLELPHSARAMLGNVRQCADTMDELFRGLLDISRLDAGAVQPAFGVFAISGLLERIRMEFEPQARAKNLTLRVAQCSSCVRSDPALVERILRNFTANALRYSEAGRILIGCRRRTGFLRVGVYDTGAGIAADHQKSVFEEFFQVGNPNRDRTRGIGLGLAIVDRLSRLLEAPVTLRSEVGKGSMFAIDLPLSTDAARFVTPVSRRVSHNAIAGTMVVVVDDEEPILDAMRGLLEQWGCVVAAARSGTEARKQLETCLRVPDALICDFRLAAGENGIDVINDLRAEFNEDIPALILTGDTGPERIQQIESSDLKVLHKPIDAETLRDALAAILAQPQAGE